MRDESGRVMTVKNGMCEGWKQYFESLPNARGKGSTVTVARPRMSVRVSRHLIIGSQKI